MSCSLPIFAILAALATAPSPASWDAYLQAPQALIAAAAQALQDSDSVAADIRQEVNLFGRRLFGSGVYRQQRATPGPLLRLELALQLDDKKASLVQVCDGRYFWEYRNLPSESRLTRIDIGRVSRAIEAVDMEPNSPELPLLLKLGGLPKLLNSLELYFDFAAPQYGRWGKHRHTVWRIQGTWKREHLLKLLPHQQTPIRNDTAPDLTKLPEHLPDQVVLILGFDDLFPYRIEYRRTQPVTDEHTPPASIVLVGLEFYNVQFNLPFGRTQFIYEPGEVQFTDVTDKFLQSLGAK